jgi:hypothetical protein
LLPFLRQLTPKDFFFLGDMVVKNSLRVLIATFSIITLNKFFGKEEKKKKDKKK